MPYLCSNNIWIHALMLNLKGMSPSTQREDKTVRNEDEWEVSKRKKQNHIFKIKNMFIWSFTLIIIWNIVLRSSSCKTLGGLITANNNSYHHL